VGWPIDHSSSVILKKSALKLMECAVYVMLFLYVAWCSLTNQTSDIGSKDSTLLGCDAVFLVE